MNLWHLLWIIPAVLAVICGVWLLGRRVAHSSRPVAPQLDPEEGRRQIERIDEHGRAERDRISEDTAGDLQEVDEWLDE